MEDGSLIEATKISKASAFSSSTRTLTGLPVTVMPIDRLESGLPIGVQIIGPYLEDRTTLAFAAFLERDFGGFRPPPNYTT
jgi:amidase